MLIRTNSFQFPDNIQGWEFDDLGWCQCAEVQRSPNFGVRPQGMKVDLLVIHNISLPVGEFGGDHIIHLFQNRLDYEAHPSFDSLRGVQVSSHFLIRRDGRLVQFVSVFDRAWHAGVSHFKGRDGCNDFSVGIELEGCDTAPFSDAQYQSLFTLSSSLMGVFPLSDIAGHQEIAPGRKTDPGPFFEWTRYQRHLPGWILAK